MHVYVFHTISVSYNVALFNEWTSKSNMAENEGDT